MIRDSLRSATLKAIRYDPVKSELFVESVEGRVFRHAPVQYAIYRVIAISRFPEKIYRHLIADHILPEAVRQPD
jgi:hypothetical protein